MTHYQFTSDIHFAFGVAMSRPTRNTSATLGTIYLRGSKFKRTQPRCLAKAEIQCKDQIYSCKSFSNILFASKVLKRGGRVHCKIYIFGEIVQPTCSSLYWKKIESEF